MKCEFHFLLFFSFFKKKSINLDTYMIFGGIPFYLDMIDVSKPLSYNVDRLFFKTNGELRDEFDFVFRSLFKETKNYQKIVIALSKKLSGLTRNELMKITNLEGGQLTEMLKNLRTCDFLRCYYSFDKKEKGKIYQLIDPFTLFYLHFVKDNDGQQENFWTINLGKSIINSWQGYAFEIVCLNHIEQIRRGLGINGINTNISSWKVDSYIDANSVEWPGAQVDLVLDRDDRTINLVEIKYSKNAYVITKDYNKKIMERIENFKTYTKTKKSVINTFITTNGLKNNEYSENVISKLTLDNLF